MNKIVKPNRVVVKKVDGEWQARVYSTYFLRRR